MIAHVEQAVLDEPITLDGSKSFDPDGDALLYQWALWRAPDGSLATIGGSTEAMAELTPDVPGIYIVRLSVSDGSLTDSATDAFRVRNHRPRAEIAPVGPVFVTQKVMLDGTGSSDPDGDPLAFRWRFLSKPRNSQAVLMGATTATPTFVVDRPGTYRVELVVTDGSAFDRARIRIRTINSPPVANAGPDQTVVPNATVALDGSASSDVDGDPLTYQWDFIIVPPGSAALLLDSTAVKTTFLVDVAGTYLLRLVVHDGKVPSAPDFVTVSTMNSTPVANAGPDQTVARGTLVMLDASASTDADGDPLTYLWEFLQVPTGSAATLSDPTAVQPTFVADVRGDFLLHVTVSDGQAVALDSVTISTGNTRPVANAGPDQTAPLTATVALNGSASTDVDGDSLTYQWSLITVPTGSSAMLSDPSAVSPSFVVDVHGTYVAQLIVNDGQAASDPDTVTITTENSRPIAEAGPNQSVVAGAVVLLDGSGSRDVDGDPLTYSWSLTSVPPGSTAALNNPTSVSPSFIADRPGTYVAQLIVNDGRLDSLPNTVTITTTNTVPVANAGPDQIGVPIGSPVTLDGSLSSDADGHALTYQWWLLSVPVGSLATLSNPAAVNPTFLPDMQGGYVAQLIVHDGFFPSAPDTILIQTRPANRPPRADAGPDVTVTVGTTALLDGTGSSDPDGDSLTFTWTLASAPPGSIVPLVIPTPPAPTLTPDVAGDYIVTLVVNDGAIDSAPDTAVVTAVPAPPTITGFSPASGRVGDAVSISGTNFIGVQSVTFNGIAAPGFTVLSSSSITVLVPLSATTGPISIATAGGSAVSTGHFVVIPTQDFQLSVVPDSIMVPAAGQGVFRISLTGSGGFTNLATLEVNGLPAGATATFGAANLTAGQSTQLTVLSNGTGPTGSFPLTVTAMGLVNGVQVTRTEDVTVQILSAGVTSLAGQFVTIEDVPIPNVMVGVGAVEGRSDAAGNFLLQNVAAGSQQVRIDANVAVAGFPIYAVDLMLEAGETTVLPAFRITPPPPPERFTPFNNGGQDQVITDPRFPGFEITLPRGVTITGWDGTLKSKMAIERLTPDKLPVPPPPGPTRSLYQIYFGTPMGGVPTGKLPVTLPNDQDLEPGQKAEIWWYDASPLGGPGAWKMAGLGTVSPDGRKVVADPGVGIDRFCGVCGLVCIISRILGQDNRNPDSPMGGDPVDLALGQMIFQKTDMVLPGRLPAIVHRTHNPLDPFGAIAGFELGLGPGWALSVDVVLLEVNASVRRLILPGNARFDFAVQPDGSFIETKHPSFAGAVLINEGGSAHRVRLKDGTVWRFARTFIAGVDLLVEQADRNGNRLTIERDSRGMITRLVEPAGRALVITHASGRITQVSDPLGRTVRYSYNSARRLETVTDPAGGTTRYTYDADGRILTITDPKGIEFIRNEYSPLSGRILRQIEVDGAVWEFRYRVFPRLNLLPGVLAQPALLEESVATIAAGLNADLRNPPIDTTVVDPRGNTTTHSLVFGLARNIKDALGQITRFERDNRGQILKITDPLGRETLFEYDTAGNVTRITDPQNNVSVFEYEPTFSKVTRSTDALENVTTFEYDAKGNLTAVTDPEQNNKPEAERLKTRIAYDEFGEAISATGPLGNVTALTYDERGNLVSVADPLGNTSQLAYDLVSRVTAQIDPRARTTNLSYDAFNQVTKITDAIGGETSFTYDPNGNLQTVSDARQNTVQYEYDVRDRLTRRVDQLGRAETFTYDANGNLTTTIDRKGQTTTFAYDPLDRRIQARFGDGAVAEFHYDAVSRLVRADDSADPHRPITLGYDVLDRLEVETTALGSVRYTYDPLGRRTQMVSSGAEPVTYEYDRNSRLRAVAQAPLDPAMFEYDAADRRTTLTLPNGVSTEYRYDQASRLTDLIYRNALGQLGDLTYQYDRSGNRIGVGGSLARSRLPDPVDQADYDAANQQRQFGNRQLTFDANGNLESLTDPSGPTQFAWDARNRLVNLAAPGTAGAFAYDALGRRASKDINGRRTQYAYDGLDTISELTNGGAVSYLRSLFIDEALVRNGTESYIADALGSTVALTNPSGAIATQYTYEPFGNTVVAGVTSDNSVQYTGRENDATGLYFYRARYYSPTLQRFISEDPLEFGGGDANLYAYVRNSPTNIEDPSGENPCLIGGLLGTIAFNGYVISRSLFGRKAAYYSGWEGLGRIASGNLVSFGIGCGAGGLLGGGTGGAVAAQRGVTVLGHKGWVEYAMSIGARYFYVPPKIWASMTVAQQLAATNRFLDRLIARGDTVVLWTAANAARVPSWFAYELEYLTSRGYTLSRDLKSLLPPGP